jgi:hypothetical protein
MGPQHEQLAPERVPDVGWNGDLDERVEDRRESAVIGIVLGAMEDFRTRDAADGGSLCLKVPPDLLLSRPQVCNQD